jgi:hypothetical protein
MQKCVCLYAILSTQCECTKKKENNVEEMRDREKMAVAVLQDRLREIYCYCSWRECHHTQHTIISLFCRRSFGLYSLWLTKSPNFLFPSLPQSKPDKPSSFAKFTSNHPQYISTAGLHKSCYYASQKMRDWSGLILGREGMGK